MLSSIYKNVINTGMIILSAAFFISPVYAMNTTEYKRTADARQILSDTEYIQQLIDKTGAGEECLIPEGEYTVAGLSVTRPVKLNGGGGAALRYYSRPSAEGRGKPIEQSYILAIWSDNVTVGGFKFTNATPYESTGIIHLKGDNLEIRDNTFSVGQNCAGVISRAAASKCVVDGNVFNAEPGLRTFPMIQFGEQANGVKIKNNILEGEAPDILTSGFLSNFLSVESRGAVFADNEFSYKGPLNEEDIGGYEDSDSQMAQEAFAEMTKTRINELNPWTRSSGDKNNPETEDGFSIAALGVAGVIQITLGFAYLFLHRRKDSNNCC